MLSQRFAKCAGICIAFLFLGSFSQALAAGDPPYQRTVEGVLTLLPKRPPKVVIFDPTRAEPDVRDTFLRMDAFVMKGEPVVYLSTHSEFLKGAMKGSSLHEYALASIIWHEMAHIDGADETEAQHREELLWTSYVMGGRVDQAQGMRYLSTLKNRRSARVDQDAEAVFTLKGPLMTAPVAVIEPASAVRKR